MIQPVELFLSKPNVLLWEDNPIMILYLSSLQVPTTILGFWEAMSLIVSTVLHRFANSPKYGDAAAIQARQRT